MPVKPNAHSVSTGNDPVAFRLQQSYIPETHLNETRTGVRSVRRAEDMSDKPTTEFEPDESLPANSSGILDWGQVRMTNTKDLCNLRVKSYDNHILFRF